ncbi:hypothetical protein P5704_024890 (plasmid) [Pseudomonas sp. FeN3W]|nr:hypothetical protein P5704_024890 [Pseudomonas sp. FeN3W]
MSASLIRTLLRLHQKRPETPQGGVNLVEFCEAYGLGELRKGKYRLTEADYDETGVYLTNIAGIDPNTPTDAWDGLTRHEAANLSANEKMTSSRVKEGRVAIKALPGKRLSVNGSLLAMPDGAHLDMHWDQISLGAIHASVLVIENWENFEKVHITPLIEGIEGNPLVLYRGDPMYNQKYSKKLLEKLDIPVYAFVDLDPEGLIIAATLPCFQKLVAPSNEDLPALFEGAKNADRFIRQKAVNINALASLSSPQLKHIWMLMDKSSAAFPQEKFIEAQGVSIHS